MDLKQLAKEFSLCDESRWETIGRAIDETNKLNGEIWECGCWKGGTGLWIKGHLADNRLLRLFDTFEGMPFSNEKDYHKIGDLQASYSETISLFSKIHNVIIHKGIIPESFQGLETSKISIAHIDLDQYESVKLCLEWVYPRVEQGGWIIFDDYNCKSCRGAKKAVNEFLQDKSHKFITSQIPNNPQAYFIKQ